jgi:hypothetical protein
MRRTARRLLLAAVAMTVVTGSTALTPSVHARADASQGLVCTAEGSLALTSDLPHHWVWAYGGTGQCVGPVTTYSVSVTAAGTSQGLGACDSGLVLNLDLDVALTLTDLSTGVSSTDSETWASQATTFPVATPFNVLKNFNIIGLGDLDTHVFLHCPPGGTPEADVVWTQVDSLA